MNKLKYIILLLILLGIIYTYKTNDYYDNITERIKPKYAIVFLSDYPTNDLLTYAYSLDNDLYDIYILVNNNYINLSKNSKVKFIQISENECKQYNYTNLDYSPKSIQWNRIYFYFSVKNIRYDHVWIIDDNVKISSIDILYDHDILDPTSHILDLSHLVNDKGLLYMRKGAKKGKSINAIRISNKIFNIINKNVKNTASITNYNNIIDNILKNYNFTGKYIEFDD